MFTKKKLAFAIGFVAFLVIIVFLILNSSDEISQMPRVQNISSSEAWHKINEHQDLFLLDVRSNEEFYEIRIPGAINIPYQLIAGKRDLLPDDRHALIFVYCRTGRRAAIAANQLLILGYTNIYVFPGMESWAYETLRN